MGKDKDSSGGKHSDDRDFGKKGGGSGTFGRPGDQGKGDGRRR